ncbi:Sensor protein FixL [Posidoniimonas polymericola]|uniref:histidine kinase n=1 Tax=Posidoniimonas polymericola TaxID=2528002 RepID=A0A5C5YLW3_9BACT|nr:ATP-binding protein [Posidoniimonas polymericola]TWT75951.1 Sensor protein FixL [Posidoniimonas polymericola]
MTLLTEDTLTQGKLSAGIAALNSQLEALERDKDRPDSGKVECVIDWREVIDTSNDAFICTDAAGLILEWNIKAQQLFGWTANEAVGLRLADTIFSVNASGKSNGGLKTLICASSAGKRHELNTRTKDGRELPVEASVSMMQCGSSIRFNAFIHDISARHELQLQLTHAQKLESIGQLSAGIAHEINTPTQYVGDNTRFVQETMDELFAVIDTYGRLAEAARSGEGVDQALAEVDRLLEETDIAYLTEEIGAAVSQTLEGVNRVASIVRAMKEFSHPGTAAKIPTDLNAAIKNTVTVATNEWKYVAEVQIDCDPNLPSVPVLPGDFNQVILNLVVNAAHAISDVVGKGGDKGLIRIATRAAGDSVEIEVSDTGTGIPEDVLLKVFDPFFTTKDVGVGTGQGLAISRSVIVDKHAGSLEASNRPEGGASFTIRVPVGSEKQ